MIIRNETKTGQISGMPLIQNYQLLTTTSGSVSMGWLKSIKTGPYLRKRYLHP